MNQAQKYEVRRLLLRLVVRFVILAAILGLIIFVTLQSRRNLEHNVEKSRKPETVEVIEVETLPSEVAPQ